ncbi:triose-phosphate isomerase [Rhizobium rhizogenes]|uniref:Triosephosphate isomerase n=1 Tax=Rhizobium rhizogenes TaxID=359 RepID=A0AA92C6K3_RHIRH|nr:triose-phosphate isomerase [Rhizobium rhizogenes]PVE56462.1 triose-phosphate isomerase [Rhizobium rhizogenes]PVE64958.1 triose-phosphate isomerase [Agrobacterium tumefaciens]PVE74096.1 triose-phosphate isomerase [Sphingomonas sp. TPD3009]
MTPDIRPLVAGNWKMNGTRASLDQIKAMAEGVKGPLAQKVESLICPPSTLLYVATALCDDSPLMIGAQDCHQNASGAHTGDISAEMIADCFGTHVIVGHSERRTDHAETDHLVRAKANAAYAADLIAIICIGETAEQRKSGQTLDVLKRQLDGSLPDEAIAANTVIAYEPVWAIGTGLTPTVEDVREAHAFMREELVKRFGGEGRGMRILYGGSVKPSNASELMAIENVDGALIGGASLKSSDFLSIYAAYEKLTA